MVVLTFLIYALSQYCMTKTHQVRDDRAFIIPQGRRKATSTSHLFTISYDRTPQVIATFLSEGELRKVLWQLHEFYEQVLFIYLSLLYFY